MPMSMVWAQLWPELFPSYTWHAYIYIYIYINGGTRWRISSREYIRGCHTIRGEGSISGTKHWYVSARDCDCSFDSWSGSLSHSSTEVMDVLTMQMATTCPHLVSDIHIGFSLHFLWTFSTDTGIAHSLSVLLLAIGFASVWLTTMEVKWESKPTSNCGACDPSFSSWLIVGAK